MEDPNERTKRMDEEARRRFIEHEKASRASGGDNGAPLRLKLRFAIPLGFVAIFFYSYSFFYTKYKNRIKEYMEKQIGNKSEQDSPEEPFIRDLEYLDEDKKW